MSADNGIYILKTPAANPVIDSDFEYRVREFAAIENLNWDESIYDDTNDEDIIIANARKMWNGCKVFTREADALVEANRQLQETYICEYGISTIFIDRVFDPFEEKAPTQRLDHPVLFETDDLIVFDNGSGEVFIEHKMVKTTIRVSPTRFGFRVTAGNGNGRLEPSSINGLPAFVVVPQS